MSAGSEAFRGPDALTASLTASDRQHLVEPDGSRYPVDMSLAGSIFWSTEVRYRRYSQLQAAEVTYTLVLVVWLSSR